MASGLIGRALGADRYELVKSLGEQTSMLAQKLGDLATKKEVAAQHVEIQRLEKAYADVPKALKTLDTNPTDPAANSTIGIYQMEKGNWESRCRIWRFPTNRPTRTSPPRNWPSPRKLLNASRSLTVVEVGRIRQDAAERPAACARDRSVLGDPARRDRLDAEEDRDAAGGRGQDCEIAVGDKTARRSKVGYC